MQAQALLVIRDDLVIRGGTREVLLDFVARDKHQKLIRNLRPEEVEIDEDGVKQPVRSFLFRDGKGFGAGQQSSASPAGFATGLR